MPERISTGQIPITGNICTSRHLGESRVRAPLGEGELARRYSILDAITVMAPVETALHFIRIFAATPGVAATAAAAIACLGVTA